MMAATGSVPADLPAGDHDDDAGQTVPIIDAATCEPSAAQTFVATLGASTYTCTCTTKRQTNRRLDRADAGAGVLRRRAAADRARPGARPDQTPRHLQPRLCAQPVRHERLRGSRASLTWRNGEGE